MQDSEREGPVEAAEALRIDRRCVSADECAPLAILGPCRFDVWRADVNADVGCLLWREPGAGSHPASAVEDSLVADRKHHFRDEAAMAARRANQRLIGIIDDRRCEQPIDNPRHVDRIVSVTVCLRQSCRFAGNQVQSDEDEGYSDRGTAGREFPEEDIARAPAAEMRTSFITLPSLS
jgi:hypothetical protein